MNIGIIGCGSITRRRHAPEFAAIEEVKIAGFFNRRAERAEEMVTRYGGRVYSSAEEMIQDKGVDAILIATDNATHAPLAIQSLEAGKHVLCEKPMAVTLKAAICMEQTAAKAGKILMIAQNQRFQRVHTRAKALIKEGSIGEILSFRAEISHGGPEEWSIDGANSWFFKPEAAVLGALGDLGIHKIDLLRWFLDDEVVSVEANIRNIHKKKRDGTPLGIDDYALCILEMKSKVTGTVTASWCNYGRGLDEIVFYGTQGVMHVKPNIDKKQICITCGQQSTDYTIAPAANSGVADAFADAVIKNLPSPVSGYEGMQDMKVVFAALAALAKGGKVFLNLQ